MSVQSRGRLRVEEYLELERRVETRSEYLDGETFAMAGANLATTAPPRALPTPG